MKNNNIQVLSNYEFQDIKNMDYMFSACSYLEDLNLQNFNENSLDDNSSYYENMFILSGFNDVNMS